jgi:uncharacterized protein (DUF1778 family)
LGIRATVGGPDAYTSAPGVAEAGPAGAPNLDVAAEGSRDVDQPPPVRPVAPAHTGGGPSIGRPVDRDSLVVFPHDGVASLDRPRLPIEHPGSRPMKPRRLRPRGAEPRDQHRSTRFSASEIALVERAVAERGPSFSGFVADAAVAAATNPTAALLPRERAKRAAGEELGRALYALGKVGNNLNQLVRQGHMGAPVDPERAERTLSLLDRVLAEIHEVTLRLNDAA